MKNYEPYSKTSLARDLLLLVRKNITSKSELRSWYDYAKTIHKRLANSKLEDLGEVPEFVWHYLSDADIRFKDNEYAELQNMRMKKFISHLDLGVMLGDKEVNQ